MKRLEKHKAVCPKEIVLLLNSKKGQSNLEDNIKEKRYVTTRKRLLHQDTISKNDKIQDLQNSLENYKTALAHKDEKLGE